MLIRQAAAKLLTKTAHRSVLARAFSGPNGIPTLKPFPRDDGHGYYLDPEEVSKRLMRIIALHPDVKRPEELSLNKTWTALGIDDLSRVEIFLEIEKEFDMEFSDQDVERFKNIHEAVEHVARSFHAR
jgi:NADH dehydrogenase (ubiquinone) 1 alpha/beta subcomplex 1